MPSNWTRPAQLSWPLDAKQVEDIDNMFQKLFSTLPLLASRGGTGISAFTVGDLLYADTTTSLAALASVSAGSYLRSAGLSSAPAWSTVKIPNTDAAGDLWYGSASDVMSALAIGTVGKVLRSDGSAPAWSTFTIPDTYAQGDVLYASATNVLTALVKNTTATRYLSNTGTSNNPAWAQITLSNGVTGVLGATNGGTGQSTVVTGDILYSVSSNAWTRLPISSSLSGSYLRSNGAVVPIWSTLTLPNASAQGDIFISTATSVMTVLAKNASATRYLSNTGTSNNPAWAQVNLADGVTGDLPYANLTAASAASKLLGRGSAGGAGDWEEITLGTGLTMSGTTLSSSGGTTEVSITTTGNIDNLDFSNANLIRMNNASLSTIRGLLAGTDGQQVTIVSVGAGRVDLAHENTNSTAANRLLNIATSGISPLAAGRGTVTYQYDGTTDRWRMIAHNCGAFITRTFDAGNFTGSASMTWTVDSGDVSVDAYRLDGSVLAYSFNITSTDVGGTTNNTLQITLPNGYTIAAQAVNTLGYRDAGASQTIGRVGANPASNTIFALTKIDNSAWTATSSDNTNVNSSIIVTIS